MRGRSSDLVVHSSFDVNFWIDRVPSVEVARPSCCVRCGFASRVPGRPLGIVGHGLRERQLRGPPSPAEPSCTRTIRARRYLCRACQAVMTVVPRDVAGRRHFTAGAIGLALFVYGKLRAAASDVAARVGLWGRGPGGWRTIRRWLAAVEDGRLFRGIRSSPPGWAPRQRAERVAMTLVARAVMPETTPEEARVFAGAAVAT